MTGAQFVLSAFVVTWLTASLRLAGPVLLAALGETFAEQSGVLNIGIEGTMLLGALASFLVSYYTGMIWISLLAAMLVGIAANFFWRGCMSRCARARWWRDWCSMYWRSALPARFTAGRWAIPLCPKASPCFSRCTSRFVGNIPVIGPVLFGQTILFYLTIALAFVAHFVLFRTNFGLASASFRRKSRSRGFRGNFRLRACAMRER